MAHKVGQTHRETSGTKLFQGVCFGDHGDEKKAYHEPMYEPEYYAETDHQAGTQSLVGGDHDERIEDPEDDSRYNMEDAADPAGGFARFGEQTADGLDHVGVCDAGPGYAVKYQGHADGSNQTRDYREQEEMKYLVEIDHFASIPERELNCQGKFKRGDGLRPTPSFAESPPGGEGRSSLEKGVFQHQAEAMIDGEMVLLHFFHGGCGSANADIDFILYGAAGFSGKGNGL